MSWLGRSIAMLRLDDECRSPENDVASTSQNDASSSKRKAEASNDKEEEEESESRGVKEDLTELKQTLTRQLWGVASFLAPPAQDDRSEQSEASESELEMEDEGMREIESEGGEEEWEVRGITEEVLGFARNIAMHPETWLDFPLHQEDDFDDFNMCDAQRKHAVTIEHLAPTLAALRIELCPYHMTQSYFWKVYFVLLHSRLDKHDAEVLSTPQVMEARAMWMQELHKQTKPESEWYESSTSYVKENPNMLRRDYEYGVRTFDFEQNTSVPTYYETEKHHVGSTEMPFIDKPVIEEKRVAEKDVKGLPVGPSSKLLVPESEDNDDDDDDWLNDEDSDLGGYKSTIPLGNEEDISFSDLEDEAPGSTLPTSKILSSFNEECNLEQSIQCPYTSSA